MGADLYEEAKRRLPAGP